MSPEHNKKTPWFQPTISFDGVAVLGFVVVVAIAWGTLRGQVDTHEKRLDVLEPKVAQHSVDIGEVKTELDLRGRRLPPPRQASENDP
jgi:hypothetical protein